MAITSPLMSLNLPNLHSLLWSLLDQVPVGRVTTYGDLADALGDRIAARWVGSVMMDHPHGPGCACHRVVRADGALGGYVTDAPTTKADALRADGVAVSDDAVDLARFGFNSFTSPRPLAELRRQQQALLDRLDLRRPPRLPELIGGVDVSYAADDMGVGAYALVEAESGKLVWSTTVRVPVTFPYISSFLTFRELPVLLAVIEAVRAAGHLADVILVDGTGILHPRRMGIATHFGIVADVRTVGVTKKLLCGNVMWPRRWSTRSASGINAGDASGENSAISNRGAAEGAPIIHQNEVIGLAIPPTPTTKHPLYVSPGHRVDVAFAGAAVWCCLHGHRLPEPLYWADRLSRAEARG
jgi:deoxyribonuclease V